MNLAGFQIFPSPTTGAFASQHFDWRPEVAAAQSADQGGKDEQRNSYSDFSFQTAPASEEAARTTTFQPPVPPALLVSESNHNVSCYPFWRGPSLTLSKRNYS